MSQMVVLLLCLWGLEGAETRRTFQSPGEVTEEFLNAPYSADFSSDGRLYVADRNNSRIHVWNADGTYKKAFGEQGEGPGELFFPMKIEATDSELYVWNARLEMSVFDLDGKYLRSFRLTGKNVRNFAVLNPNLILIAYQRFLSATDSRVTFDLIDAKGEQVREVKDFKNDMFLAPIEGNNNTTLKAFGPEADIQEAGDGTWYFGFSNEKKLYQINKQGEIIGERVFQLPTGKPSEDDIELVQNMSFPGPGGQRISLKSLPNLKMNFDHDKAYYTHFLIHGNQVIFVLTPLGGTNGVGNGFSKGSYVICDLKSGKPLKKGNYDYREDSSLLFRNGRVLGFLVNQEDEFEVRELAFSSM